MQPRVRHSVSWYNKEMDFIDPQANPATPEEPQSEPEKPTVDRSDDIRRAAELAQKRSATEAQRKADIKQAKADELAKGRALMQEDAEKKEISRERKKGFRVMKKARDAEVEADKIRRQKEEKAILAGKEARDKVRKEKQRYMHELHENAAIKQAREQRLNAIKAEADRQRTRAEAEHRRKIEEAERTCAERKEQAERDARARKSVAENELHTHLYQEESWYRSKMRLVEAEVKRQARPAPTPADQARQHAEMQGLLRARTRKLDQEKKDRHQDLQRQLQTKHTEIDNAMYAARTQAENDLHQMVRKADNDLARQIEDIERSEREQLDEANL